MNVKSRGLRGHIAIFVANLIFGVNVPLAKTVVGEGGIPWQVASLIRIVVAAVLFWGVSLFIRREKVRGRDLGLLFLASLFAISLNQPPFLMGLSRTTPFNASMLSNTLPIVTLILSTIFLREPLSWKKIMGVVLGIVGAVLLVMRPGEHLSVGSIGDVLVFSSLVTYSIYITVFKGVVSRYSPVTVMKWFFLFSTLTTAPFLLPSFEGVDWSAFGESFYLRLAYLSVFATFLAYLLIPIAQKNIRPTIISMYSYVNPIVAGAITLAAGMDSLTLGKVIAVSLIFVGVYLVSVSRSREDMEMRKADGRK